MELDSKYTIAGLFVLVVSVLILVTLLWLSDAGGRQGTKEFAVVFTEHSLDGLQKDSVVTMKGIKVGTVESFSINDGNIEIVEAILRIDKKIPIKVNMKAVVRRNVLTGLAWIDLVGGTQEAMELEDVSEDSPPVIAEGKSEIDKLASSLPSLIKQASETLAHVRELFSEENTKHLSATLQNISEITAKLNSSSKQLDSILNNADTALAKVATTTEHFEGVASELKLGVSEIRSDLHLAVQQFNNESVETLRSVRTSADAVSQEFVLMSQSVGEASQSISRTMEAFEQPRDILTGTPAESFGPGE